MSLRNLLALVLVLCLLSACATSASKAVIAYPANGQSADLIALDKAECEQWAQNEVQPNPGAGAVVGGVGGAAVGAGIGAALGGILGAFIGQAGNGAALGAALGGATGGIQGAAGGGINEQQRYFAGFRACMAARGYAVQ